MRHTWATVPRDGTPTKTPLETATAFFLRRNLTLTVRSKMSDLTPCGSVARAPVGTLSEPGHRSDPQISGFEVAPVQHDFSIHNSNLSTKGCRRILTRAPFAIFALLAFATAVGFLVLRCSRALTSGRSTENHGVTTRRLVEEGRASCFVSHHV